MEHLYQQFIREKQYLCNVSPRTVKGYPWAWKAFEPARTRRYCVTNQEILQRIEKLHAPGLHAVMIHTRLRSVNTFG